MATEKLGTVLDAGVAQPRVVKLDAIPVEVPWKRLAAATDERAYRWAFGVKRSGAAVVVRLETDDGRVGWGETTGLFHPNMPVSLLADAIRSLEPAILGQRPHDVERFAATAYNHAGWHFARGFANYAISGIEMACWDLIGKCAGAPVSDLLGGRVRDRVEFMYFVYRDEPDVMVREALAAVEQGFETIYVKIGIEPREDLEILEAVRDAIGPERRLRADANEAWSPGMAVRMINAFAHLDLEFIEQPVLAQDVVGLADVRGKVAVPVCADQAARTPHDVLNVVRHRAADLLSVCPGDAGGLLAARKSAAIAEAAGLPVFLHSNIELGIATAAHVQLAAAMPNCHYANQTEYQLLAGDVLCDGGLTIEGGRIEVPQAPGIGVAVDEERLAEFHEAFLSGAAAEAPELAVSYLPGY